MRTIIAQHGTQKVRRSNPLGSTRFESKSVSSEHEPGSYLIATLEGQPRELERILADSDSVDRAAKRLAGCSRVFLVGTGTSYHGALAGQYMLRSAGIDAWAIRAFEFATYTPAIRDGDGLILLSHRGTKRYSQKSLELFAKDRGAWVAITGISAPIEGEGVVRTVENERSPVHTASHTGALMRLAQLSAALGTPDWAAELAEIPLSVRWTIDEYRKVLQADARDMRLEPLIHYVGGGPGRATAYEGALKVREASHMISAEGHDLEGLLHGPLISIQAEQVVVLIAQHGLSEDRNRDVARALTEIDATLVLVGSAADELAGVDGVRAAHRYRTPLHHEVLAPIVNVVPLQLLAYEASRLIGVDADSFRRDEKAYAAAQSKFTL